jgi:hypothetical protein
LKLLLLFIHEPDAHLLAWIATRGHPLHRCARRRAVCSALLISVAGAQAMKSAAKLRSISEYHEEDGGIVAPSKVRDARAHD